MATNRTMTAIVRRRSDGTIELRAPAVGVWSGAPERGAVVREGGSVGRLDVLGRTIELIAPAGGAGAVIELGEVGHAGGAAGQAAVRRAVAYGDLLIALSQKISGEIAGTPASSGAAGSSGGRAAGDVAALALRAPSSGRYYGRPGPGKPAFVQVGDTIAAGQTVCLLEVMKTFNRVTYGGEGLPERARVARIAPGEGDDLAAGDVILELARE